MKGTCERMWPHYGGRRLGKTDNNGKPQASDQEGEACDTLLGITE